MFKPYGKKMHHGIHEAHERIVEHATEAFGIPSVKGAKKRFAMPKMRRP